MISCVSVEQSHNLGSFLSKDPSPILWVTHPYTCILFLYNLECNIDLHKACMPQAEKWRSQYPEIRHTNLIIHVSKIASINLDITFGMDVPSVKIWKHHIRLLKVIVNRFILTGFLTLVFRIPTIRQLQTRNFFKSRKFEVKT